MFKKSATWVASRVRGEPYEFDEEISSYDVLALMFGRLRMAIRGQARVNPVTDVHLRFIGRYVKLSGKSRISLAAGVTLGDFVHLSALSGAGIALKKNVNVGAFTKISVSGVANRFGGVVTIGENSGLGEYCYLGGAGGIEIGKDVIMGQYVSFHSESHLFQASAVPIRGQNVTRAGITVGDNCWVGSKATFLDGASVSSGSVVAAGAVVRDKFERPAVLGGVPARKLKDL